RQDSGCHEERAGGEGEGGARRAGRLGHRGREERERGADAIFAPDGRGGVQGRRRSGGGGRRPGRPRGGGPAPRNGGRGEKRRRRGCWIRGAEVKSNRSRRLRIPLSV